MTTDNYIIATVFYTFFAILIMTISVIVFIYYSRKKLLNKELEKKQLELNYQKQLLQTALITQEDERNRIAQDLHDAISSKMNVITLNANLLSEQDLSKEEYDKMVSGILSISSTVLESSRRIAHDLLPPILDKFGLNAALEELFRSHNNSLLSVNYENIDRQFFFSEINKLDELHVFRIFQELINNSVRHGKATVITIKAVCENGKKKILYNDNGSGFEVNKINEKMGIGMKNIESRVAYIGGNFEIESNKRKGVNVILTL